jgi:hypothetical protein
MHEKIIDTIGKLVVTDQTDKNDVEAMSAHKKYQEDYTSSNCLLLAS